MAVTDIDLGVADEPPADVRESSVLATLLQAGRWGDAATYYPNIDDPQPIEHAQLLLGAGRSDEAHTLLTGTPIAADDDAIWPTFVRRVDAVMHGDTQNFPDLVTAAAAMPAHPLVRLLMLRAADAAARPEVAAHFARLLREHLPGDVDAARALAVDLVQRGDYVMAVQVVDRAELARCVDEPDPLDAAVEQLARSDAPARVGALVTIGHFMHREKDPTQPVSDFARAARQRWSTAYRAAVPRRWGQQLVHLAVLVGGIAASIPVGNVVPLFLISVAYAVWTRTRPLPGLDIRTSQLVRTISDPLQILNTRHYRVVDVFTFVFTGVIVGGLVAQLPHSPSWLNPVEAIVAVIVAAAATRGRRRWVRHERRRLQPPPLDPDMCCCLEATNLHGERARRYVTNHLFAVGSVRGAPQWRVLQCLDTHTRFLDLRTAQLTLRLPPEPSRQPFQGETGWNHTTAPPDPR